MTLGEDSLLVSLPRLSRAVSAGSLGILTLGFWSPSCLEGPGAQGCITPATSQEVLALQPRPADGSTGHLISPADPSGGNVPVYPVLFCAVS